MSEQISAVPTSPLETFRNTADYHASLWDNHFLDNTSEFKTIDTITEVQYDQLRQEVRRMIMDTTDTTVQKLNLIDIVQRLGVAYHFEKEIEEALDKIYHECDNSNYNDLHIISLFFRLFRQQGIKIPCDVFQKFKDDDGKFKASLIDDVQGMLSLYEAAQFSIHGEDILDEALNFTTTHLRSMVSHVSPKHLAEKISHALNIPLRKDLPRLGARFFISSVYPKDESHNETLLMFAKLDFNLLQKLHQNEIRVISQWRKNLNFTIKLPYARDRVVEAYFWALGFLFEPRYVSGTRNLSKTICIMTLIDDTYDSYGTYEELKLFTEAIKRWDIDAKETLPDYMKLLYKTLLDFFSEIEENMAKEGKPYCIGYAIKWMQSLVEGYFNEAKWLYEGYVPTPEDYMVVALETAGCELLTTIAFLGMGDIATKDVFEWVCANPKIIRASNIIGRLMNDKASHKFEQKRGHIASAVECYMKKHAVSEEEAVKVILEEVANAWKDMNDNLLKPNAAIPRPVLEQVVNYSRVVHFIYKGDYDIYTVSYTLKDPIALLFKDPIP